MNRAYYDDTIDNFLNTSPGEIFQKIALRNEFPLEYNQKDAWLSEIRILKQILPPYRGSIYFEYSIPRMGQRIDVVILIGPVIFVIEFKIGENQYTLDALDQVMDYALDLKNFHEPSHREFIAPILVATKAKDVLPVIALTPQNDKLLFSIKSNLDLLGGVIKDVLQFADGDEIDRLEWEQGHYCPTPTIVEAAMALYATHTVKDIHRNDADEINIRSTSVAISNIIRSSKLNSRKSICFVTGVPGAGKTLVGLDIATTHIDKSNDLYSVYLSGNGPLVKILREALARDKVKREKLCGRSITKSKVMQHVKMFIQNVHNFRDDCLVDMEAAPIEHVALFDEAQRAWNLEQTSSFMSRKKNRHDFDQSEPEFLMSCLNRHKDWAVVVCLVGGGQEINTGEAGISEWITSLERSFTDWDIYISNRLTDSEYNANEILTKLESRTNVAYDESLHLAVSMRSFRSEHVSLLVKQLLDLKIDEARNTFENVRANYPIVITRDVAKAKNWLRQQARGTERYGIVVSSQAERLRPHAIFVDSPMDPVHWFLDGKEDIRSSYYLEDVATEFDVQGLELDWVCVTWDADFRYTNKGWEHWSFVGTKWNHIRKKERQNYLKNAYRVLLTRARQGMIIVVPDGDNDDRTRMPQFYDSTFDYLREIGFTEI